MRRKMRRGREHSSKALKSHICEGKENQISASPTSKKKRGFFRRDEEVEGGTKRKKRRRKENLRGKKKRIIKGKKNGINERIL